MAVPEDGGGLGDVVPFTLPPKPQGVLGCLSEQEFMQMGMGTM